MWSYFDGVTACSGLAEQSPVDPAAERSADERRYPEQPQLLQGPSADKDGRSGASRGIDRSVSHGNAHQVNQGEAKADGDGRKALGSATVSRSHNDQQEECGQDNLRPRSQPAEN